MLATYKAILQNGQLRWLEGAPAIPADGEGVPVLVTLAETELAPAALSAQSQEIQTVLSRLAARDSFANIDDPVAWQREQRADRELPGRE